MRECYGNLLYIQRFRQPCRAEIITMFYFMTVMTLTCILSILIMFSTVCKLFKDLISKFGEE